MQRVGRWAQNSTSFRIYIQNGIAMAQRFLGRSRVTADPVYKFWRFCTSAVHLTGTG